MCGKKNKANWNRRHGSCRRASSVGLDGSVKDPVPPVGLAAAAFVEGLAAAFVVGQAAAFLVGQTAEFVEHRRPGVVDDVGRGHAAVRHADGPPRTDVAVERGQVRDRAGRRDVQSGQGKGHLDTAGQYCPHESCETTT